ncbi:MAG: dihydroorotate dehydrogenase electron transfer subunit [Nitrospirota bacterium]
MSKYFRARIKENRKLNKDHNLLILTPLTPIKEPEPGQFYMIGMGREEYDPLLKRPFSPLSSSPESIQILYRIRGRGTLIMSNMGEGSVLDILGPLGNAYPMPARNHIPLVIAGGIGIASLFSLSKKLSKRAYIFYGARKRNELLLMDELKNFAKELFISTNDGSVGEKCDITDILKRFLNSQSYLSDKFLLYLCGPKPMLKAILEIIKDRKINAYVSMEENMACGIGACLGCAVKTVKGYKMVCKEGPVFPIEEIVW